MLLESEPTPLLQNSFGIFYGESKTNLDYYKMII